MNRRPRRIVSSPVVLPSSASASSRERRYLGMSRRSSGRRARGASVTAVGGGFPPCTVATDRNSPSQRLTSRTSVDFPEASEPTTPMTAPPESSVSARLWRRTARQRVVQRWRVRRTVARGARWRRCGRSRDASARPSRKRRTVEVSERMASRSFRNKAKSTVGRCSRVAPWATQPRSTST